MASSAEPCSSQSLTMSQAIGVGVVTGFVGAVILVPAVLYLYHKCFSTNIIYPRAKNLTPQEVPDAPDPEPPSFTRPDRELSYPPQVPRSGWEINPIERKRKNLTFRIEPLCSPKQISENVGFEYYIESFVSNVIIGRRNPADRRKPIEESIFDENQLIQLAGEPANGDTWSGFISNPDTRALAIACLLSRILYRRMSPLCDVEECLLAPEITTCYRLLTEHSDTSQNGWDETIAVWRETVYLKKSNTYNIRPPRSTCFDPNDRRAERTYAMVPAIVEALKLRELKLDQYPNDVVKALKGAFENAANSAVILFGQPSEWQAVWESDKPGIIVFPEIRLMWHGEVKYRRPARNEFRLV
ncbi:hypothetical protein N0V84_000392 [Fusarium piperis]|uniref:Uncharacterized protein n=1 Tax=Fusarium piperis TaxID=1435070 RepID=A0A9W8WMT2_9HYPO|nr:hypothetical protein N0V84_000392 [Fusarium piperis]